MSFVEGLRDKYDKIIGYRLLVLGSRAVCVEGHRGVFEISESVVRLKIKGGGIVIKGDSLLVKEISDSEVFIEGIIEGIEL